jgi:hypothetical protein
LYERHIRRRVHEPADGVTIRNNVSLRFLWEKTGMAHGLLYICSWVCRFAWLFRLLLREAQFESGPRVIEGPTEETQ